MQDELKFFDYGARFYDPVVARWTSIDPMAEEYDEWSPYNYTLNNPTTNIDPNGMWTANAGGLIFGGGGDELNYKKEQIGIAEARGDGPDKPLNGGTLREVMISDIQNAPRIEPFNGFWGMAIYYFNGGYFDGYHYNTQGIADAYAPKMGLPPDIGKFSSAKNLLKLFNSESWSKAAKRSARLFSNGVKLAKQLASEAQMTEKGITIIGPGKLREATRLASEYGGKAADWVKKSSSSFTKGGTTFETHWYENISTGARVEFKTKFP